MCSDLTPVVNHSISRRRLLQQSLCAPVTLGLGAGALALFFGESPGLFGADTPAPAAPMFPPTGSWATFRNGPSLRGVATTTLPDELSLRWEIRTPDGCMSTPAIADGRAYVGTLSGDLLCLSLKDGSSLWKYASIETDNPKVFRPGFSSPVTLTQSSVIVGDDGGTLHCVDRETGKKQWQFETNALIVGAATVRGSIVIFGSHNQYLYGLDLATGKKQWEFDAKGPVNGTQAILGTQTFVSGCSEPVMYVVNAETGVSEQGIPIEDLLIATPALVDEILYFGTSEGLVLAMNGKTGKQVWKYETKQGREIHSAPAVTDDSVIIGGRDKLLYCLDRATGKERWLFPTRAGNDNSPVVVGDRVFFGSGDKFLYEVDLKTGKERWKFSAGQAFTESSPAVGDESLLIATSQPDGRILCFGAPGLK